MTDKKQLHKQAIAFSVIMLLSWMEPIVLIPAVIMIAITLFFNYYFKPDLSRYFKIHIIFGFVTNMICNILYICFYFLPSTINGSLYANLAYLYMNLHWIVPVVSLLLEVGYYIKQRLYKKPKEFIVLITSNAGICILFAYVITLFIIGSNI